ncbi:MAG: protein kinase [Actinomycetia bacterium]|nr:protein kinase [Actinomycetes bacterium]MCP5033663.1 protein kinase [Actinomycetes bacterium]
MDRIGRYEVVERIGSGGFATVYRVRDSVLDSEVAAKVLAENWTDNVDLRDRFMREAQLLRRIDSHRVVTVHDIGELPSGQPYFVMSLANRGTLEDRLSRVTSPSQEGILGVAVEVAACVRAVHDHDLIHRDIKPSNLLVTGSRSIVDQQVSSLMLPAERLVLGDFGLAKDVALQATNLTIAAGTGGYAAPEQMNPQGAPDRRTDLYATTAVMYRVISGVIPPSFEILHEAVPFPDHEWWMGGPLGQFFRHGMAFRQDDRHHSIEDWSSEFRDAFGGTQQAGGQQLGSATTQWASPSQPSTGASDPGYSAPPVTPGPAHFPPIGDPASAKTQVEQPQSGYPQTGQPGGHPQSGQHGGLPDSGYSQTGQQQSGLQHDQQLGQQHGQQHGHGQSGLPLHSDYPQTGQPSYQPPAQAHYSPPSVAESGPPSQLPAEQPTIGGQAPYFQAPSFKQSQQVKKRTLWPWLLGVVVLALAGVGGFFTLQGPTPTISGPPEVAAGQIQTYTASFDGADSYRWTDWNGDSIDSEELEVRAIAPGQLSFSVVAINDGSESRSANHTVTIVEADNGPEIVGPAEVTVGNTAQFTFSAPHDDVASVEWIDPTGQLLVGDTYKITPRGEGSWEITLIVTRQDGTRIGTRREIELVR